MTFAYVPDFSCPLPASPMRLVPGSVPLHADALPVAPMLRPVVLEVELPAFPAPTRLERLLSRAGDLLAAVLLIAGGCAYVGLATLF